MIYSVHVIDSALERARPREFGVVFGYFQFHAFRRANFVDLNDQKVFKKTIINQKHDFHGQFLFVIRI